MYIHLLLITFNKPIKSNTINSWLVVLTILNTMKVNGKDYPFFYGKKWNHQPDDFLMGIMGMTQCDIVTGWCFQPTPFEKIWVRQSVGMINYSQLNGKSNKSCSKAPASIVITIAIIVKILGDVDIPGLGSPVAGFATRNQNFIRFNGDSWEGLKIPSMFWNSARKIRNKFS